MVESAHFLFGVSMLWIVIIIVILLVVTSSISSSNKKAIEANNEIAKKHEFDQSLNLRVESYGDFLRKNSSREDIVKMSDAELRDYLRTIIKRYNSKLKTAEDIGAVIFGAFAIMAGIAGLYLQSWFVFFVVLGLGGLASVLGVHQVQQGANDAVKTEGLDVDRLKIE